MEDYQAAAQDAIPMQAALSRIVEALQQRGCEPKQQENEWHALCPICWPKDAKEPWRGKKKKLSVWVGKSGRLNVRCNCSIDLPRLLAALGLADVLPQLVELGQADAPTEAGQASDPAVQGAPAAPAAARNGKAARKADASNNELEAMSVESITPQPMAWLWPGRIPLGSVSLLIGKPGVGKSFVTLDLAARVSCGLPWPDGTPAPQGDVILLSVEDDPARVIRPRLEAHGADLARVHLIGMLRVRDQDGTYERLPTLADVAALEQTLDSLPQCKLLIVDPVGSFLGGRVDAHRDNEVRSVLAPLAKLAETRGVAILLVCHTRKGGADDADDLALGSRAFVGIARAAWHVTPDPHDKDRRLLVPGKNNLAPRTAGLAFRIDGQPPRVVWTSDPIDWDATEAHLRLAAAAARKRGPEAESLQEATQWLSAALANGPKPATDLYDEWCHGQGGSKRTLERAKKLAGVFAFRKTVPGPWLWKLPQPSELQGRQVSPETPKSEKLGDLGGLAKNPEILPDFDPSNSKAAKFLKPGDLGEEPGHLGLADQPPGAPPPGAPASAAEARSAAAVALPAGEERSQIDAGLSDPAPDRPSVGEPAAEKTPPLERKPRFLAGRQRRRGGMSDRQGRLLFQELPEADVPERAGGRALSPSLPPDDPCDPLSPEAIRYLLGKVASEEEQQWP